MSEKPALYLQHSQIVQEINKRPGLIPIDIDEANHKLVWFDIGNHQLTESYFFISADWLISKQEKPTLFTCGGYFAYPPRKRVFWLLYSSSGVKRIFGIKFVRPGRPRGKRFVGYKNSFLAEPELKQVLGEACDYCQSLRNHMAYQWVGNAFMIRMI